MAEQVQVPEKVEQLVRASCQKFKKPPLQPRTRILLASLEEEKAANILRVIISHYRPPIDSSLDALIIELVTNPTQNVSPSSASPTTRSQALTPTRLMMSPQSKTSPFQSIQSPIPMQVEEGCSGSSSGRSSPQLMALGELEFRKAFLILSYLGRERLEEVLSAEIILRWKDLSMGIFESEVWKAVGYKVGFITERERPKSIDWNSGGALIYHCYVLPDGTCRFKGPFLASVRNILQRTLGDDNVLLVKFAEEVESPKKNFSEEPNRENSSSSSCERHYQLYEKFLQEGILVGLRRYRFFVFKAGDKEEKKKDPKSSYVKCFFVRMESDACNDSSNYILSGKTVREARSIFMHLDTLEKSLSNYMARFSLILSKTLNLEIDLSCVEVEEIADKKGQDEHGNFVNDDSILTDGTGFISEDLAVTCPKNIFKGSKKAHTFELPPKTIQVRRSMIKVRRDPNLSVITKNSLEVVGTSNRPKRAFLSKMLILLLFHGGVPKEFFMHNLCHALEDANSALVKKRAALRVALNNGGMGDLNVAEMILSGIPLEESYLQHRLSSLMKTEKNNLKVGRIPVSESYYLMGTADPTGCLEEGEVCVILDNGQISGDVLVYRNPGLHFGDIHILNAKYVDCMEDFVGNSKYAIFFPCKGRRSIADEIAGGDYDGDMYFVSRNPQLLEKFTEGERWISPSPVANNAPKKKPRKFSDQELEEELFKLFLETRFNSSPIVGMAADSWVAMMDRFITLGVDSAEEKRHMKDNICRLIDIYYDALDAPKSGKKVELSNHLKAELFPHYMERNAEISYKSTSIMGLIYDKVKSFEQEDSPNIEVWKLPGFCHPIPKNCLIKWEKLYKEYREKMENACNITNKELKDEACDNVYREYKEILYGAAEFENKTRPFQDIFDEACAIYNITYDYASWKKEVKRCSFAWTVAGSALCKYYILIQNEQPSICSAAVLKEILG